MARKSGRFPKTGHLPSFYLAGTGIYLVIHGFNDWFRIFCKVSCLSVQLNLFVYILCGIQGVVPTWPNFDTNSTLNIYPPTHQYRQALGDLFGQTHFLTLGGEYLDPIVARGAAKATDQGIFYIP